MTYAMELHEAHVARLSRLQVTARREASQPPTVVQAKAQQAEDRRRAIEAVWPEVGPILPATAWKTIVHEVCLKHGVDLKDLLSARREKRLNIARQEAFYRLRTETDMSMPRIGYRMGGRDHTTVLHGVKMHKARMAQE